MKKFRHLEITADSENVLKSFLEAAKNRQCPVFKYKKTNSIEYAKNIFTSEDMVACFKTERKSLFQAMVWMVISNQKLWVANITSTINSSLGIVNYNLILMTFFDEVISPLLHNFNVTVNLTGDNIRMSSMLHPETFELLNRWQQTCNKSMPIAHPGDYKLWMQFVVSYCNKNQPQKLSPENLEQWLEEDCNWRSAYNDEIDRKSVV